jgi:hypothetical protein
MIAKYGVYDGEELRVKMDAIKQKPRQRVQLYHDKLEHLFVKGKTFDAERRRRFMAHFKPEIKKLCKVHTYADMDEMLAITIEVEKAFGEIGETPFHL